MRIKTFCNVLYLICLAISILFFIIGMFNLCSVLFAKTSEEADGIHVTNSNIFFSGIKKIGNRKTYLENFYLMSKQEMLDELITQIYINADIASKKYNRYNKGFKYVLIGFSLFIVIILVGISIF